MELAARMGETLTQAVVVAVREQLARRTGRTRSISLRESLAAFGLLSAALPVIEPRAAEQTLGYDARGLTALW
ncbi:type II toxin-antitoxin system VapB family antitoxin [Mycobacterium tuberculosis]